MGALLALLTVVAWPAVSVQADSTKVVAGTAGARAGVSAVAIDGLVYLFGGETTTCAPSCQTTYSDVIESYDPATGTTTAVGQLPSARSWTSAVAVAGKAYVFGGDTAGGATSQIVRFDPATGTASVVGLLASARGHTSAATDGANVYVYGGRFPSGSTTADIVEFSVATGAAVRVADLPGARSDTSAAYDPPSRAVYVTGGRTSTGQPLGTIVRHVLSTGAVTTMVNVAGGERSGTCAFVADRDGLAKLYVVGGLVLDNDPDPASNYVRQVVVYQPSTNAVVFSEASLAVGRAGCAAVWTGDYGYVFGGRSGPDAFASTVERVNLHRTDFTVGLALSFTRACEPLCPSPSSPPQPTLSTMSPGDRLTVTAMVTNTGVLADSYLASFATTNGWPAAGPDVTSFDLAPGQSRQVTASVTVPDGLPTVSLAQLTVRSLSEPNLVRSASGMMRVPLTISWTLDEYRVDRFDGQVCLHYRSGQPSPGTAFTVETSGGRTSDSAVEGPRRYTSAADGCSDVVLCGVEEPVRSAFACSPGGHQLTVATQRGPDITDIRRGYYDAPGWPTGL